MKVLASVLLLSILSFHVNGQIEKYPKGVYMSFEEIKTKSPSLQLPLNIIKRTKGDIKMSGGNDYKLESPDKSIKKKTLKKEYWAYSKGDTLFINCFHYKVQPWYAAVLSSGRYLVFKGGVSADSETYKKQMSTASAFGAIGGAIGGAKIAIMRFVYVIDTEDNSILPIEPETLEELLKEHQDLFIKYKEETDLEDSEVLIDYMDLLNKRVLGVSGQI